MTVASIIKQKGSEVTTISPHKTLQEAAELLGKMRIGAIVVADTDKRVCGILSERDIVRAVSQKGCDALKEDVSVYMTKDVVTCRMSDSVERLMEMMTSGRMRHLPVVEEGMLAGLVSIGDVVKRRINEVENEAESLKAYIASG